MLLRILLLAVFMLPAQSFYDFKINNIDGAPIRLSDFKGKKILVVNTASECGHTPQYAELEKLYQKYKNKLVVIAFPANNFGGQEPGSNKQIKQFCSKNYGVSFLVAEKVSVKGGDIHPLFQWLTSQPTPDFKGDINWNFEKFLLDENGKLVHRFRSKVKPLDPAITAAI
jgi:glutathione peroxidase